MGKTSFGFEEVSFEEKTQKVKGVFDRVANRYDIMNDLMSGGLHRLWKRAFLDRIPLFSGAACLDVAGGTGDIALGLCHRLQVHDRGQAVGTPSSPPVIVCDLTPSMVTVGRDRALDQGFLHQVTWTCGAAENLPFPDNHFDIYTIAFGLRNVTHLKKALQEANRVLKPGGRFYCLEFSKITDPFLKKCYDLYAFNLIPKMGALVAKDEASYRYLAESIEKFPDQSLLAAFLKEASFTQVAFENLTAGCVAIHSGMKRLPL